MKPATPISDAMTVALEGALTVLAVAAATAALAAASIRIWMPRRKPKRPRYRETPRGWERA